MPVWNRVDTISHSIKSVLAQTLNDYELLIIDDGSEDNLEEIVRPFLSDSIIYHKRPRLGVGAARNFALEHARGAYIAYLDSDNTWQPDFLAEMYKALHSHPRCQAAYCKCSRFKKDSRDTIYCDAVLGEAFDFKKLVSGNFIDLNTFVHSKQALDGAIRFDESLKRLNDWDFILKVTMIHKPVFVKKNLVNYNYGFHHNTISCNEDFFEPLIHIKQRYRDFDTRTVELNHDGIMYRFENVPDKKYYNYLKTSHRSDWNTKDFIAPGFPYMLQIEPTNFCNLSCTVCPAAANKNVLNRKRRHLRLEEFKKIINDMEEYLLFLVLWEWGEPFLNPELPEMIRYASEKGIKTVTSTNAHFLNEKQYLERILTSGLSTLIIAIDSLKKDSYEFYRRGGNLAQAMAGLNNVLDLKKKLQSKTLINLRMVLMKSNETELADMRNVAKKLKVDTFTVKTAYPNLGGPLHDGQFIPTNPKHRRYEYKPGTFERIRIGGPCTKPWFMFNIHSNGNVVACNNDYNQEMIVGNAFERPLTEIWNAEPCRNLRKKLFYDKDTLPKCRECDINFKLSRAGWFVEVTDCNISTRKRLSRAVRNAAQKTLPGPLFWLFNSLYKTLDAAALNLKHRSADTTRTGTRLRSAVFPLELPLATDQSRGWTPYPVFLAPTQSTTLLGCHASALAREHCPHPPHAHPEEEILLLLSGELELIFPDEKNYLHTTRNRIAPLQLLFYPAGLAHTLKTLGAEPANYLMLKWKNPPRIDSSALPFSSCNLADFRPEGRQQTPFQPRLVFEGPTAYLKKLRCDVTTLAPQAGYAPHKDHYDVLIVVLDGEVETLGQRAKPYDVIFYAAGEPHGMSNPSLTRTARYVVFELHAR
jgi:radical SAM protein with 4Fe4S-binding SPASM domain